MYNTKFQLWFDDRKNMSAFIQGVGMLAGCTIYILLWFTLICYKSIQLKTEAFLRRYGRLFNQIDLYRSPYAKYYHVFFLCRRLIYVGAPLLITDKGKNIPLLILV